MPLEIASSMESLTGAAVSKTKIKACNKNILLWRIFEHKNPNQWSELDLKNVYMYEVQPQGYTFPFDQIIRSLHYERFVKDIKGEVGRHTYIININKVINYVKKIQPIAPPPSSPKKNKLNKNRDEAALKFLKELMSTGTASNSIPIRVERLKEKYSTFVPGIASRVQFSVALQHLMEKGLVVHCEGALDKVVFQVDYVKKILTEHFGKEKKSTIPSKVSSSGIPSAPTAPPQRPHVPIIPHWQPTRLLPHLQQQKPRLSSPSPSKEQRKTNNVVRNLMKDNGLVPGRREWSKGSGSTVNNRKTFVDQRFGFRVPGAAVTFNDGIYFPQDIDYCCECAETFESNEKLETHIHTDQHKFMVVYGKYRGKGGIRTPPEEMSGKSEGITVHSAEGNEGCETYCVSYVMETEESVQQVIKLNVTYAPQGGEEPTWKLHNIFSVVNNGDDIHIDSSHFPLRVTEGTCLEIQFAIQCAHPSFREFVLAFKFCCDEKEVFVMKTLSIHIDNPCTVEESSSFQSPKNGMKYPSFNKTHMNDEADYNIIEPPLVEKADFPPLPNNSLKVVNRLKDYPLPWQHIRFFNYGFSMGPDPWVSTLKKKLSVLECFDVGLVPHNYAPFFQLLLYLEEHQILCDLRVYAMKDATLQRSNSGRNNFYLTVPGLAEKRPSVLKCDAIYITSQVGVYKGFVNLVEQSRIRFSMGPGFVQSFRPTMLVSVHFSFNRSCLKVQHRALEVLSNGRSLNSTLFPKQFGKSKLHIPINHWYNVNISKNPPQRQAVQNILNGTSIPAPFVLFGPPGTGKTVTLVESMKQIYFLKQNSHILAVAPSNAAADLLALKILDSIPPAHVIRLYSPNRHFLSVPAQLKHISNFKEGECVFPALKYLMGFRIIVCTEICAGRLYSGNFPPGFFSHIFIDECGHSMEPSALVAIAGLLGPESKPSQVVLSGDPKQLGPIVRSPVALSMGLGDSFLVRLMDSIDLYQKADGEYNSDVITKLTYNYRSHPQILKVPNNLFYDGELVPCGDTSITASACDLPWLPQKGFPLIFHGVNGKDEQHPSSPSFFNTAEVYEVIKYARKILSSTFNGKHLCQSDIGVVSPYRGQLQKISRTLKNNGMPDICVGSVEEFQGQERRVIIISTVRSNPAQLKLDQKFSLGFVREPRRFNVAITRASALLIVIGNPHLLQTDPNWRALLEHIYIQGGYTHTNCPFQLGPPANFNCPSSENQMLKIQQQLRKQMEAIKSKIIEMEGGVPLAEPYDSAPMEDNSNVDHLITQIRKLNFFTEHGPMGTLE